MEQTLTEHPESGGLEASAHKNYVARFGSFILRRGDDEMTHDELHKALLEALSADSRITLVAPGSANHEWTVEETFYPRVPETQTDALISGASHFHSVRFPDALMFRIQVPVKNQPQIHGEEAESDTYFVAWDGCTVVVMWKRELGDVVPSIAGGQVVDDILKLACKRAGQYLYVQACSPACKHLFAHTQIKVDFWEEDDFETQFEVNMPRDVRLSVKAPFRSAFELVAAVHDEIKIPAADFAELKNTARRILDIESSARSMSFELIGHDYETLNRSQEGLIRRVGYFFSDAWSAVRGKGRAKKANLLIASLWLSMANMETLQQLLRDVDRRYQASISEWAVPELFAGDLKSEEAEVASLDPHFARAAIAHKTQRMDNRVIVWATIGGAGTGAAITAVLTGVSALP